MWFLAYIGLGILGFLVARGVAMLMPDASPLWLVAGLGAFGALFAAAAVTSRLRSSSGESGALGAWIGAFIGLLPVAVAADAFGGVLAGMAGGGLLGMMTGMLVSVIREDRAGAHGPAAGGLPGAGGGLPGADPSRSLGQASHDRVGDVPCPRCGARSVSSAGGATCLVCGAAVGDA